MVSSSVFAHRNMRHSGGISKVKRGSRPGGSKISAPQQYKARLQRRPRLRGLQTCRAQIQQRLLPALALQ
jgi:hypothetical protein